MTVSNTALAEAITSVVAAISARDTQFAAWLSGSPTGGPGADGRYPLTDFVGVTRTVTCPAKLEADADAALDALTGLLPTVTALRDECVTLRDAAVTARVASEAARDAAVAARDLTLTYRQQAAAAAADVITLTNAINDHEARLDAAGL